MTNALKTTRKAQIRKEVVVLQTYPYSDPSPIPEFGRLYPYNRFDGYTNNGSELEWEMVVIENDYIKLWINPAVGGKIWGAMEKSTGKEFIYFNHSAKFRDVAMRGPWTSGGMETNMGIIGHAPSCSAPVDFQMQEKEDGSVSCFIGATDWPSRTEWRIEVNLCGANAYFTTKNWWYNSSPLLQSYYQWNNLGIKTSGNLEYIYPGHSRLSHDGTPMNWPKDEEGREIAFYEQNNHGEYKSYHVFGSYTDFWGCYWHNDQFGLGHSAAYDDKPGKKIWIWGLSRYGMVWEDLLTDSDGQYTEVQSGRLFNQSIAASSKTPFKHRSFLPYTLDTWEEQWFPVKDMDGLSYGNKQISFYLSHTDGMPQLNICANEPINHTIQLLKNDLVILETHLQLDTMENFSLFIQQSVSVEELTVRLNDRIVYNGPEQHQPLKRPVKIHASYDFGTAQALCIQAREWEKQRFFERAIRHYQLCLKVDPFFLEALTGLAGLHVKQLKFEDALELLSTALGVDTYHAEANYLYGLVNDRLGNTADAKDGFSIASQSPDYRAAAYTELSKLFLREGQLDKALNYVKKAQFYQPANLQASYLEIVINRLKGNTNASLSLCKAILSADPISYLARFELNEQKIGAEPLTSSELPYETYIELASFYSQVHLFTDALKVLSAAPDYAMVFLWKNQLFLKKGMTTAAAEALQMAAALPADFVFPHREEDIVILESAVLLHDSWKFKYYLALAYLQNLRREEAMNLLESCEDRPDFYPFYLVRAGLNKEKMDEALLSDLNKAYTLAPREWRTTMALSKYHASKGDWKNASLITERGLNLQSDNYYLGLQLAKCYMHTQQFEKGTALMNSLVVLPNEGASEGRNCWRETHLFSALAAMTQHEMEKALHHIAEARSWPEHLGVGKPYHVDERLEDYMQLMCLDKNNKEDQHLLLQRIAGYRTQHHPTPYGSTDFITILLLERSGDFRSAERILNTWKTQDPEALALKWTLAFRKNNHRALEEIAAQQPVTKEVLPYEIPFEDRSFLFIKKLYTMGLFNKYTYTASLNNNLN